MPDTLPKSMHQRAKELFKKEAFAKDAWDAPPGSGISAKYAIDIANREVAAESLIYEIKDLILTSKLLRALNVVYDTLDKLLLEGDFLMAKIILRKLVEFSLPRAVLVSAQTVAFPWREQLGPVMDRLERAIRRTKPPVATP